MFPKRSCDVAARRVLLLVVRKHKSKGSALHTRQLGTLRDVTATIIHSVWLGELCACREQYTILTKRSLLQSCIEKSSGHTVKHFIISHCGAYAPGQR